MEKVTEERLKGFSLFNGLDEKQRSRIAQMLRQREFKTGDDIVKEGEVGGEMFLLLKGEIVITKRLTLQTQEGSDQKAKSLIKLKDKDNVFFGEMSLFDDAERSATVSSVSDVTCGILTREQIHILCKEEPQIGYCIFHNIGRTLSANLRKANRDILKLTTAFCLALER
jgi:CRP-like cAMP-binding protein